MSQPEFEPLRYIDGYQPIEDHGLIGDGRAAALVARDGSVPWLCAPRFDSPPVFCALLDHRRGGAFRVAAADLHDARQHYLPGTGVLVTQLRTATGVLEITDALTLHEGADLSAAAPAGRGELLRQLRVREGEVTVRLEVHPRGEARTRRDGHGWTMRSDTHPDLSLHLAVTGAGADGAGADPQRELHLRPDQVVHACLGWNSDHRITGRPDPAERLHATVAAWRRWSDKISYDGPQAGLVHRSAITLKLLDYLENGAIVAAPTSSLPETLGGVRNWDYRYTWVRDAAFTGYALRRVGLHAEADSFLQWVLEAVDRMGETRVLYDLDGRVPGPERLDPGLEGYRGSSPVRWGNGAVAQRQHDVFGEILDSAYLWVRRGGQLSTQQWSWLRELADRARARWPQGDHGIWEVRTTGRPFTYSVAMCQVALDRAARLAEQLDLPGDRAGWAAEADKIRQVLLEQAWDPEHETLTAQVRHRTGDPAGGLDAGLLALPLRRVLPATHPRMQATTAAIARHLGAGDGLLYRYLPKETPDGLTGHEGAFLLCSFWLVDNLAYQGRLDEAGQLFDSLCGRANPLGLLPEQIDPGTGAFLGNFPQAFSHIGVIGSAVNLARLQADPGDRPRGT